MYAIQEKDISHSVVNILFIAFIATEKFPNLSKHSYVSVCIVCVSGYYWYSSVDLFAK